MGETPGSDDILHFGPVLKGSDAVRAMARGKALSAYQLCLIGFEIFVCLIAFGIAARVTGLIWLIEGRPSEIASLLLLSLVLVLFFSTYCLYNCHHISLFKKHLVNLLKSFCWSILTLVMIFSLESLHCLGLFYQIAGSFRRNTQFQNDRERLKSRAINLGLIIFQPKEARCSL